MTIQDINSDVCTGCCTCMNICKQNAIHMKADKEGFYIPEIDAESCVDCGMCYRVCPAKDDNTALESLNGYLIRLRDESLLKNSASGGAFAGIAKYMLEKKNAIVVGAAVSENLSVNHVVVESLKELHKLQSSKYVQSYMGDVSRKVCSFLKNGRTVLFSGTPCQIAGLYRMVPPGKRENLYTIDLVCHGVPSPELLKRQIEMDSQSRQGKVVDYRFRYKNPKEKSFSSYMMMMMMSRGLPIIRRTSQDLFFNLFMKGLDFRECCYNCKYANLKRIGDFTVGDCDSREFYPEFYPDESNSILLINTQKARELWNEIENLYDFTALDVRRESEYNHQLNHPFIRPKERNDIYNELLNKEWAELKDKYTVPQNKMDRYKLLFLLNSPRWVREILSKLKRG